MGMIIITNPGNSCGVKKKDRVPARLKETAGSMKHISCKKYADKQEITGDLAVIVGRVQGGSEKLKALPVPFVSGNGHMLYSWTEKDDGVRFGMPDNVQSLQCFSGPVRVYTEDGLILSMQDVPEGAAVSVFRTQDSLFVRAGRSLTDMAKEKKSQQLAQMGIWRA